MASPSLCVHLASIPTDQLPVALHNFFADSVCELFRSQEDVNAPPKDQTILNSLSNPLQWMLCGGDPNVVLATVEKHGTPSNFCGKVFKSGEPAYFCKDCQTDPTCCLCMECFEHSDHKNHKYRLFASGGGGCCDCGDPEAWTSGVHCELHEPVVQMEEEVDPVGALPPELAARVQVFFKTLLRYCMDVLAFEDQFSVPNAVHGGKSAEGLQEDSCLAYLYNDEVHSYDEVIHVLTHMVRMTHTAAVALATLVDRKGRAVVMRGKRSQCEHVTGQINSDLAQPLKVDIYHTVVSAHQENAIVCLSVLKDLAEKTASFRRVISQVLVDPSYIEGRLSILDCFFRQDSSLWISARISWHRLVMSSVFMDPALKKNMAISLCTNYSELQKNFVSDSHHHDVCASNMTVQIFTAPSLSRMLVLEHGLLTVVLKTLQDLLSSSRDSTTGSLKLRQNNYKHSRIFYVVYDLRYILRTKPEQWTQPLRQEVLKAYDCLLELLSWLQNADPVRRQRQLHVEREEPWEHCFNFSIVLQPAILLFLEWCTSDATVLQKAVSATCAKHKAKSKKGTTKVEFKPHVCEEGIVGRKSMELIMFDILKEPVSVHQPLPRIIAVLLSGAHQHGMTFPQLLKISPQDQGFPLFLMEFCSRSIVMAVQVMAGMWKRNGYSVVNQIINYQYHLSREIMYDKDVLMLQCMAAILDPNVFMYALIYKFRLEKWLSSPDNDPSKRGEPSEDALRFFISEAEEFLFLLIVVFTERYSKGVGEGMTKASILQREIIHRLFISPLSHSEILKQLKLNDNECDVDGILREVASLRRLHGSTGKYVYELKPAFEGQCCPFFYHYTKPDHSKAEEIRRKKNKAAGKDKASSPMLPPPFTPPFSGVMLLAQCPVLHRMLYCVLKQAASPDSKFWSDKLLHEALYFCGVILAEEDSSLPNSLCNTAIGASGNHSFLPFLEVLLTNQRAEEHRSLLSWCVQYLRTANAQRGTESSMDVDGAQPVASGSGSDQPDGGGEISKETDAEREAKERRERALQKRDQLMSQISVMQKKFLQEHKEELDQIDAGLCDSYDTSTSQVYNHQSAVGPCALLYHSSSSVPTTCILCQEETSDFAKQPKPFVQAVNVHRSSVLRKEGKIAVGGTVTVGKIAACEDAAGGGEVGAGEGAVGGGEGAAGSKDVVSCEVNFLSSRSDQPHGVFTGGCAHHMHAECWKLFLENKRAEHGRHHFFPLPGQSVKWELGEFLCPMCECYGNTVVPLLPEVGQLSVGAELVEPSKEVDIREWRALLALALEVGSGDAMDTGENVEPTFMDKLEGVFSTYSKPRELKKYEADGEDKMMADMHEVYSQSVFMSSYEANPDVSDTRVCVSQWSNCAYVISGLEYTARKEDKFLLSADTLSPRQLNVVRALVRLGSEPRIRPEVSVLTKHLQYLTNCFLLEGPAFSELPAILDVDCFLMFVNLHFSLSSLFISLSSPYGHHAPLKGDPVILQLMGITDAHLVRLAAAAQVLQFLLTFSPTKEAPSPEPSDSEMTDGKGLQKLWTEYRKIAKLQHKTPPSPNDLSVCLQQHMYPFLQCVALFLKCLTGIDFIHSSATMATHFEDLCKYVGLPADLSLLFEAVEGTSNETLAPFIAAIARNWCTHPKLESCSATLQEVRQLVQLPGMYSELVKEAAAFQCPKRLVDTSYAEDGQATMLCLVCGELLCTNSYCCQKEVEKDGLMGSDAKRIGGLTQHVRRCGAGVGVALWILESYVVLLDATKVHSIKGCTLTPPYLDEYREPDPGLRRGHPMQFNKEIYQELQQVWFQHSVPQRIRAEMEKNPGLLRIKWDHM